MSVESSAQGPNGRASMDPRTLDVKRCPHCTRYLALGRFSRQSGSPDGLQSWCKECAHERGQPPRKGTEARARFDAGLPPEGAPDPPPPRPKQIHDYHVAPLEPADIERLARALERMGADDFLAQARISMTSLRNLQNGKGLSRYVRQKALIVVRQALGPPPLRAPEPAPEVALAPHPIDGLRTLPLPLPPSEPLVEIIPPPPSISEEVLRAAMALENNGPLLEFLVDFEAYVEGQLARGAPLGTLQQRFRRVWLPSGFRTLVAP